MSARFIVGLDIGTASVRAVVIEHKNGRVHVRGTFREASGGVKKGVIQDLAEATSSIGKVLHEVRRVHRSAPKTIYVNVGTHHVKTHGSRGIVAVSRADSEIYQDDVERVQKTSIQTVASSPNRMVVHNITREYIVDGVGDIQDPLGLSGNRLEVSSLVVDAFAPHVKAVIRVIELAGGRVGGLVLAPIAASRAALTKSQRDLGVVLVDIGAGTTGIAIYEENKIVNVAVLPVGAGNITNDVAVRLRIPVASAENLKLNYGYAVASDIGIKESIDIAKFAPGSTGMISRRLVAETIEDRLAEMLELVNTELKLMGKVGRLAGGAVFVGGGAKLPGLTELARDELKLASQIGCTVPGELVNSGAWNEAFEDPEYVTAFGIAQVGAGEEGWLNESRPPLHQRIIRYFMP